MTTKQQICHQLAWQPEPAKKSEVRIPYEEGKILPNSPEEEIELPALRAPYSSRQLRSIKRRQNNLKMQKRNHQRMLLKDLSYEVDK